MQLANARMTKAQRNDKFQQSNVKYQSEEVTMAAGRNLENEGWAANHVDHRGSYFLVFI